jgi:uncharacterized protein (DUF433 family)
MHSFSFRSISEDLSLDLHMSATGVFRQVTEQCCEADFSGVRPASNGDHATSDDLPISSGRWYSRIMTARITMEPGKRSGQPCVRGLRITVWDVLSWLAGGMTEQEILADYPELEADDFRAVYDFAAHMGRRVAL